MRGVIAGTIGELEEEEEVETGGALGRGVLLTGRKRNSRSSIRSLRRTSFSLPCSPGPLGIRFLALGGRTPRSEGLVSRVNEESEDLLVIGLSSSRKLNADNSSFRF